MRFRDVIELKAMLDEVEKKTKEKDKEKGKSSGSSGFANTFALLLILFPFLGPASVYMFAWSFAESAKMLHTIWP